MLFPNLNHANMSRIVDDIVTAMLIARDNNDYNYSDDGFLKNFLHSYALVITAHYGITYSSSVIHSANIADAALQSFIQLAGSRLTIEDVVNFLLLHIQGDVYEFKNGMFSDYGEMCDLGEYLPIKTTDGVTYIHWTCPHCNVENESEISAVYSGTTEQFDCENCMREVEVEV